jgi:hypothetical protein
MKRRIEAYPKMRKKRMFIAGREKIFSINREDRSFIKKHIIFLLLIMGMIPLGIACHNRDNNGAQFSVTADQISDEYLDNKELADGKYKSKLIEVKGYFEGAGHDFSKNDYILLKTNHTVHRIKCFLKKDQKSALRTLLAGSYISVTGRCDGELMGDVVLKDCNIK